MPTRGLRRSTRVRKVSYRSAPAAHDSHDPSAGDSHAFDPEPASEMSPDEPRTPLGLTAVGALLLALAGAWWLGAAQDDPAAAGAAPSASPSGSAAAGAAPGAAPAPSPP